MAIAKGIVLHADVSKSSPPSAWPSFITAPIGARREHTFVVKGMATEKDIERSTCPIIFETVRHAIEPISDEKVDEKVGIVPNLNIEGTLGEEGLLAVAAEMSGSVPDQETQLKISIKLFF